MPLLSPELLIEHGCNLRDCNSFGTSGDPLWDERVTEAACRPSASSAMNKPRISGVKCPL